MNPDAGHRRKHPKLSLFWKIASISGGTVLILLGIVGLFLPILQGWLMILAGLALLSPHSKWAHSIMTWLKARLKFGQRGSTQTAPAASESTREIGTGEQRRRR